MTSANASLSAVLLSSWLAYVPAAPTQDAAVAPPGTNLPLTASPDLQAMLDRTVASTLEHFQKSRLRPDDLAITLLRMDDSPHHVARAHHRGNVQIYPASVIKLFYLVAAHQWLESGKLRDTDELRRAMSDMIVHSYNEATHYVIDLVTDTTSGPELSDEDMEVWYEKRNAINRYFASLGYEKVNANRKPWCEGPYGREMQSVKRHVPNHRNWLTTDETARLMWEIATGRAVSAERGRAMMTLLQRDPIGDPLRRDQGNAYTGAALPPGARLWSKAGWTSQVRHDAAYVELADGPKFVLVTFTERHARKAEIIPYIAGRLIQEMTGSDDGK